MPKKATIKTKAKSAGSEKARPPRVMFDKKTGKYYVKVGKLKIPFPKDLPYEKAVQQSIKKIRSTAPRKRKAVSAASYETHKLDPLPGFSNRSTKDSPLSVSYANLLPETQAKIAEAVRRRRRKKDAIDLTEEDTVMKDLQLYQKKALEAKAEETRKEEEKRIKVEKELEKEKKAKVEKKEEEKSATKSLLKAKRYVALKKFEHEVKSGAVRRGDRFSSIIDNLDDITDEDLADMTQIRIQEEKEAAAAAAAGQPPKQGGILAYFWQKKGNGRIEEQIDEVGLYSDQIISCMKEYLDDGFIGVVAADELEDLIKPSLKFDKFGFVMNKDPSDKPGSHWVAVYVDTVDDCAVEYYDSFAEDPDPLFLSQIKKLIDSHDLDIYLKFKINRVKEQAENSPLCGFHAMRFLIDRFKGKDFKECSGYSNVRQSEKQAGQMMKKFDRFGYI